jgi:hypothetical protein
MPDGRIIVDPGKKYIVPFSLVTEPATVLVSGASDMGSGLVAGGTIMSAGGYMMVTVPMPIDRYPFEICFASAFATIASGRLAGMQTDQFTIKIFDAGQRSTIQNDEIHYKTLCGGFGSPGVGLGMGPWVQSAGGRPFIWKETLLLDPGGKERAIFVQFRNLTTEDINIRFCLHGVRYYAASAFDDVVKMKEQMAGPGKISWPYFYTLDQAGVLLDPNQSRDFDIRLTDESGVEIFTMTKESTNPFLWRLQEKVGQRYLDNSGPAAGGGGIHCDFGFGDGEFPFIPFESMYMEQDDKLMLTLSNTLSQIQNHVFVTFHARKIRKADWTNPGEYTA